MKILFGILLAIVVYIAFEYIRFRYTLYRADNLPEIVQVDQTIGNGPKLKYIAAGDSTAVGGGTSNVVQTYPYQIAQHLAQTNSVEYKNVAVNGATTSDLIKDQIGQIVKFDPDIITISIGANDMTHFTSVNNVFKNYQVIIKRLTDETHAKVYITNVPRFDQAYLFPWPLRTYFDHQAKVANTELSKLGSDRIQFIDIHSVEVANSADKFHPSDGGYRFWTDAFLAKMR